MVSRGKDYRPEFYCPIPSRVDIGDEMPSPEEKSLQMKKRRLVNLLKL